MTNREETLECFEALCKPNFKNLIIADRIRIKEKVRIALQPVDIEALKAQLSAAADEPDWDCEWVIEILREKGII